MATHVASQELYWAVNQCSTKTMAELKQMVEDGTLANESLFTYAAISKAVKHDFRALQWLWEMAMGKPKQQIEHSNDKDNPLLSGVAVTFVKPTKPDEN